MTALRLGKETRVLDAKAIEGGVRLPFPKIDGVFVWVLPARDFNEKFSKALREKMLETFVARGGELADSGVDEVLRGSAEEFTAFQKTPEFIATALVEKIEGIFDEDGNEVEYTPEIGVEILSDGEIQVDGETISYSRAEIRSWIVQKAQEIDRFYHTIEEKESGNSKPSSSSKKGGGGRSGKTKG